jgi:hypothetical protein
LGRLHLEDAELGGFGGLIGLFAEGTFGEAGTGLARGDELAGKLDEIRWDFRGGIFEDGRLTKDDLIVEDVEGEHLVFIYRGLSLRLATDGSGAGVAAGDLICVVEPDGEAGGGFLRGGWGREKRLVGRRGRKGWRRWRRQGPLIEFGEELVLGVGGCLGTSSRGLGGGFSGADCVFSLLGEEGAVALGVGVTLGNCCSNAGGAGVCRGNCDRGPRAIVGVGAACAMGGETLSYLLLQRKGSCGCGFRFGGFRLALVFVQW